MVIVTTAVYWRFNSPLHRLAGLTGPFNVPAPGQASSPYTASYDFAWTVFLVNSRFPLLSATHQLKPQGLSPVEAPLLLSYGGHLPSSLTTVRRSPRYSLPDHLCRFGVRAAHNIARGFSRQHRIIDFTDTARHHSLTLHAPRICLWCGLHATPGLPSLGSTTFLRHPIAHLLPQKIPTLTPSPEGFSHRRRLVLGGSAWALLCGYGNINPLSIDYASRPRLRSRLTQSRLA